MRLGPWRVFKYQLAVRREAEATVSSAAGHAVVRQQSCDMAVPLRGRAGPQSPHALHVNQHVCIVTVFITLVMCSPLEAYSELFKQLAPAEQIRKVEGFARLPLTELRDVQHLSDAAKAAIVQVGNSWGCLAGRVVGRWPSWRVLFWCRPCLRARFTGTVC
jgi:hypothetical protein